MGAGEPREECEQGRGRSSSGGQKDSTRGMDWRGVTGGMGAGRRLSEDTHEVGSGLWGWRGQRIVGG